MRPSRALVWLLLLACSCSRAPRYELQGQIVAVDTGRQEITVKHGDIKGFMPGMTMPFKVKDPALMAGKSPGDLVRATLVIEESLGYLSSIDVTGHAPLTEPPPDRVPVDLLPPGSPVPDVSLVDQDGVARHLSEWRGQVVAVTFIYTRCPLPDFCPLLDRQFLAVQGEAATDAQLRDRLHLVSITLDPAYDRPAVLREHAARLGAQPAIWSFVTGEREDLDRFGSTLGVSVMRDDPAPAGIVHNLRTAVIDPQGRLTTIFTGNDWRAPDLLKELRRAAALR